MTAMKTKIEENLDSTIVTFSKLGRWITSLHLEIEEEHFKDLTCELTEKILDIEDVSLTSFIDILTNENTWTEKWNLLQFFLEKNFDKQPSQLGVFHCDEAAQAYVSMEEENWSKLDKFSIEQASPERDWFQGHYASAMEWFEDTYDSKPVPIENISMDLTSIALEPDHPFGDHILIFLQFLVDNLKEDRTNSEETVH